MEKTIEVTLPTLQPRQPFNWYKYLILACIITTGVILFQLIPKCNTEVITPFEDLSDTISAQKIIKDSIHERVIYKDRWRTEFVVKWRTLKGRVDTIPCEEALPLVIKLTDSIITVDSSLIAELKAEVLIDNLIIATQDKRHSQDSIRVRRLKRQRNLAAGVGLVGWILAAVR